MVRAVYLPPGEGVDDFLAAGNAEAEVLSLATTELREPPPDEDEDLTANVPYRAAPGGLIWDKPTQNGSVPIPLTNFTARIVADVAEDDGAEVKRHFEIEARNGERHARFDVPAAKFASMNWPTEHLGALALVYPGFGTKDHARAAIQLLSEEVEERRIYTHTGWREVDGVWGYLHGGGAIGPEGVLEDIEVRLNGELSRYRLPSPPVGEILKAAVLSSLGTWEVGPDRLVISQHAGAYRAAMAQTDFSVHATGPTGEGKSEIAALFGQHFGAGLDARHLISWESTENALEAQTFALKDSLAIVDDFAPNGPSYDVQRWHKKADRFLRAKGNAAGRARMAADLTMRTTKPPRALILSTGEDTPRGQSLRARMLVLEHGKGDVDWDKLTECQRDAEEGLYAQAMAGFISWLAPRYEEVLEQLPEETRKLREEVTRSGQHKRTAGIAADLGLGLRYFLNYAEESGAVSAEEAQELWERGWKAIREAAASQEAHQAVSEPAGRFIELLRSAISSGRAHIGSTDGERPEENAGALGWRKTDSEYDDWRAQGDRIGWVDGEDLYLEPAASYRVAQREAQGGEALTVGERTLRKRLKEKGFLLSTDKKRQTLTVRRTIEGVKDRSVLHLRFSSLFSDKEEPDEPDDGGDKPHGKGGPGAAPSSGSGNQPVEPDENPDEASGSEAIRQVAAHEPDDGKPFSSAENPGDRRVRQVGEEDRAPSEDVGARAEERPGIIRDLGVYQLVSTTDELLELIRELREVDTVAVDLETVGLNPATLKVRIISVTTVEGTWLVDCFAVDPSPLPPALTGKTLVFHNASFDLTILVLMGLDLGRVGEVIDTLVMSRLVENKVSEIKEAV
jgi:3'-5' exonuclease